MDLIQKIRKRDFSIVRFTSKKISDAVLQAFEKTGEGNENEADIILFWLSDLLIFYT